MFVFNATISYHICPYVCPKQTHVIITPILSFNVAMLCFNDKKKVHVRACVYVSDIIIGKHEKIMF